MPLSAEDALRLNVMLANKPQAIRIDESRMQVCSLGENGESRIELCANCGDDKYLKQVKEMLSGQVLGSPGGYPVFIRRWTRMGQMRDDSLEQMLLIGEPEAVVAVVHAEGLTDELARRAWWIMEEAENARQMLRKPAVVTGSMGALLAEWLVEFLPFETEPAQIMDSMCLVLQEGLLDVDTRAELWNKARRKPVYYLGFLVTLPDQLPDQVAENPRLSAHADTLLALADAGNDLAALLYRTLSAPGQTWLRTLEKVLQKPSNQDVINAVLDVVAGYFNAARPEGRADQTLETLQQEAVDWVNAGESADLDQLRRACPGLLEQLRVLRVLSGLGYGVVRPVFGDSTAIGSLMRRKLSPVLEPLAAEIGILYG